MRYFFPPVIQLLLDGGEQWGSEKMEAASFVVSKVEPIIGLIYMAN